MPGPATRRLTCLVVALAAAVTTFAPGTASATDSSDSAAVARASTGGCQVPLLDRPTRGSAVKAASSADLAAAARVNNLAVSELAAEVSVDRTLWLDTCGHIFFVEPRDASRGEAAPAVDGFAEPAGVAQPGAPTDPGPLSSALMLESKPGSTKTIYLDFNGGTVSGTGWNADYTAGAPITAAPYSIDSIVDTSFSTAELTEIQKAWQVVAEDYAPFDVNVTTKPPAAGAIDRSGPADLIYGTRVLITGGGPIYSSCSCGGIAYINTFSLTGSSAAYYQPAWVFSNGTGTSGKRLGEAASHEAGHNVGLHHDGTATASYYSGSAPWAPIMGAAYNQPISQFSRGEYPSANNGEDDLSLISAHLAVRSDDHANTAVGATLLSSTPVDGVITSRTDTDAFTFVAAGTTTLTATPGPGFPDLDIGLRILGSTGAEVAYVDPPATPFSSSRATGLDATWTASLPATPATYTAIVDGVGSGDPLTLGKYSDYGSLGNYRITLNASSVPAALVAASTDPAPGTVGVAYSASPASATGGTPPYSWTATTALPPGLILDAATGSLTGTPTTAGSTSVTLRVTDAVGTSATTSFALRIDPAPAPTTSPPPTPATSPTVAAVTADPVTIATRSRTSFSTQLVAAGGTGAYAWTATGAPSGVIVSSTGVVSGSVGLSGTYSFPATVTSGPQSTLTTVTLSVLRRQPLAFATTKRLTSGHVGRSYKAIIATRGAEGRVTWKKSGKTPPGLRLAPRKSGRIKVFGLPTKTGTYVFRLVATDATGAHCVRRFTLTIVR